MSIELKQVAEQSLDLSTPTLREMVTRHAAVIDSRATLEDMPEALAFQIDMARALLREFAAIQQVEAQQPDNTACKSVQKRLEAQQPATRLPEDVVIGHVTLCKGSNISLLIDHAKRLNADVERLEAQQPATGEPVMDVRCEGCGYMTHHREHMGCVRAAKQHTHPAADTIEHHPENVAAKQDAAALNWIERQHLEEPGMGLVIDAPNDGKYYVCGDSGTTHYGKTLREAVASAIAEGA